MALKPKKKTLLQKFEKLHLGMKFLLLGGSAYLLYRKFRKEGEPIPLVDTVIRGSATQPLVAATAQPLLTDGAQPVAYNGASPDQVNAAKALPTSGTKPLDAKSFAEQTAAQGTSLLFDRLLNKAG